LSLPADVPEPLVGGVRARLRTFLTSQGHASLAQRMAGTAFVIRVANAAFVYLTQVVFAHWMGSFEFGIYVYVWTWVLLVGDLIHLGLAPAAQKFIPQYAQQGALPLLRGFITGSRWLVLASATATALLGALLVYLASPWLDPPEIIPLYLACASVPAFALSTMLDGIARSYNWTGVALLPAYIVRPVLIIVIMLAAYLWGMPADAVTAMSAVLAATWLSTLVQAVWLSRGLARAIPPGPKTYEVRAWLKVSLPILMVWGFYTLLTYTDVLVLSQFRPPEEVALYYAASKTLALVAFVYFSVGAAVAHRFSEYHASGDRQRLADFVAASIRWTFWPSLAAMIVVLGYPLMFVLAVGLLARSSVGPAERLLSMLGEQRACAAVYGTAFGTNLVLSIILVQIYGALGAALATAIALVIESLLLFLVARRRLGLHAFVWR
jgi:O-antigen/teichoic acid export membrane protein